MFLKPVASLVAIVVASLATSFAYAAPEEQADTHAQASHVRELGGAKKRIALSSTHGRGRHAPNEKTSRARPKRTAPVAHAAHANVDAPAASLGVPVAQPQAAPAAAPATTSAARAQPSQPPPSRNAHAPNKRGQQHKARGTTRAHAPASHAPAHGPARQSAGAKDEPSPPRRPAPAQAPRPCQKTPVEIVANTDADTFILTACDGRAAMYAAERLSILARPGNVAKPTQTLGQLARIRSGDLAPGIKRVSYGLVERLQKVVDHFAHDGKPPKVMLVSGYRPASVGSYHARARAMDFRLDGVTNEALVAFCKTLDDTGCGYYPNSVFIHMDVRDAGAGHVAWIDASGPGESPRYVDAWPPPDRRPAHPHGEGDAAQRADRSVPPPMMLPHEEPDLDDIPALLGVPEMPMIWEP